KNPAKWLDFAKSSLDKLSGKHGYTFKLKYNGKTEWQNIKAAIISNNPYDFTPTPGNIFKKKSLSEGKLGVYLVNPQGTLESLQLLSSMAFGSWQNDKSIEYFDTKSLS